MENKVRIQSYGDSHHDRENLRWRTFRAINSADWEVLNAHPFRITPDGHVRFDPVVQAQLDRIERLLERVVGTNGN